MNYLIGLDIGTQGTKGAIYDASMREIATSFAPSRLVSPEPGVVWQEPDEMLAGAVEVIKALASTVDPSDIAAIGLDGQMAGIMGIDARGEASTVYDSWLDMRCGECATSMLKIAGNRATELSGGQLTYVHAPKMLWWKNTYPEAYAKTARFVLPHAYIVGRMCNLDCEGAYYDYTHLHFSCLADNEKKAWSRELCDIFGLDMAKLPRIASPFEVVGKVSPSFAAESGLVSGTPVVAGAGDTAASTFGAGLFSPGVILDIAGTASVLAGGVDYFAPDVKNHTLTMMRSPVDGLYAPLSYIAGGGLCVRWLRDVLASDYGKLEAEASDIPPGSEGLMFVPHFSGRVLPNNPKLKGAFLGLDFKHTRAHMYRAVLESVAYEYAYYLDILKSLYPSQSFSVIKAMGGGSKSKLFNRIKSEVLGIPYAPFESGDTALTGSAVIAGCGVGLIDDYAGVINSTISYRERIEPRGEISKIYAPFAERYLNAIDVITTFGG
ncbi:MAG: FGGY family carbohydrate kinase [Clostridia bacterium]|nr:FGGY family carbohydrate kinase [Clostridia bacterium]